MNRNIEQLFNTRSALNGIKNSDLLIEIDEDLRNDLQYALLEMYKDIYNVCKKYSLTPYLIGGSALGAVRHKGFIPWDDDIDVGMSRADYMHFVEIFEDELSDKYILNAPNISKNPKARFAKIFKKGTICKEITDLDDSLNGIFLDIFIIENIPRNLVVRKIRGTFCNLLQFISSQVYLYKNDNPLLAELFSRSGEFNYKSRLIIGKLFSFINVEQWFNSVDRLAQYKYTGIFGIVTGRKHYFGEIFEEKIFFPACYIAFCDIEAPIFNNYDIYLKNLYHNYMELPPVEKRERHYVKEIKL